MSMANLNPYNSQGQVNHLNKGDYVQVQDVGPEWNLEFPGYTQGTGSWPLPPQSVGEAG